MRFAALIFMLVGSGLCTEVAQAAVVQRINEEKDKLIVELSAAELAALEENQEVVIECQDPRFVTTGVLKKMNLQKKTVIVVLDEADVRFAKRQRLIFLPYIQNTVFSHHITVSAHYHQYTRSLAGAEAGSTYQSYKQKIVKGENETTNKTVLSGYLAGLEGYLLFDPEWFGASFGFERRGLTAVTASDSADATGPVSDRSYKFDVDLIRPAAWVEVERNWRIGLNLDYYMVGYYDDTYVISHSYNLFAPKISAVRYSRLAEFTFFYQDRAKFDSVTTYSAAPGISTEIESTAKIPAEIGLSWRSVSSPTFVWSSGLGWVFYERELSDAVPIRRKAGPEELLRLSLGFEHRLASGSKFDWSFVYAGAQIPSPAVIVEQNTNQLHVNLGYHTPIGDGLLLGGNLGLNGGLRTQKEDAEVEGTEESETTVNSVGGNFMVFIQKDFDLLDDGRKRR